MPGVFRIVTKRIVIIANIIVVILFLLVGLTPHVDPQPWWILSLLALGFPLLFLLVIAFLLAWLFTRPTWALLSLFALIISWNPIRACFAIHFERTENQPRANKAVKIMSWNVHLFNYFDNKKNPAIKQHMLELIREQNPDVACFQEFFFSDTVTYPYSIQSFRKAINMPYYAVAYASYADARYNKTTYHYGVVIFSKYPILQQTNIIGKEKGYNDVFEYADIVTPIDTLRFFNVHLQSLHFEKKDYKFLDNPPPLSNTDSMKSGSLSIIGKIRQGIIRRAAQASIVKEVLSHSPYPVVVCGDFNDVPNSYAYVTIKKGLKDAFQEKGNGFSPTFSQISPTLRIDYILFDQAYKAAEYHNIQRVLSDHFPIITTLYDPRTAVLSTDHLPLK